MMERDSHVKSCRAGIPLRGSVTHGTAYTPYLAVGRRSSIALMISSRGKQEVIIDAWLERLCNCDRMATWNQTRVEPLTSRAGPSRGSVAFVISLVVGVLADIISKENKQEWDNSLNYDRYRPGRSGIAVHDAPVYPCR